METSSHGRLEQVISTWGSEDGNGVQFKYPLQLHKQADEESLPDYAQDVDFLLGQMHDLQVSTYAPRAYVQLQQCSRMTK